MNCIIENINGLQKLNSLILCFKYVYKAEDYIFNLILNIRKITNLSNFYFESDLED